MQKERQFFDAKSEYMFNASNQAFTSAGLYERIRDAIGARTVVESSEFANHPEAVFLESVY